MSYNKEEEKKTDSQSGKSRRRKPKSNSPRSRSNPSTTPDAPQAFAGIPSGYGITVPRFLLATSDDEFAFIPLGFTFGHYLPLGDNATTLYSSIADGYLGRILARLRELGYPNSYSSAQVRAYINDVSELLHLQRFITHVRSLNNLSNIHTGRPISAMCAGAINGRLVAVHRNLTRMLETIPYPPQFYKTLVTGLDATTLSDNPNSGIRIFGPKSIQPDEGDPLSATTMADLLETKMQNFFSIPANVELTSILPFSGTKCDETLSKPYSFNGDVVNNLLNLGFRDDLGVYTPAYSETENVPLFYRRSMTPYGLLTFSPDDDLASSPEAGTVWAITESILDTTDTSFIVANNANFLTIRGNSEWFALSGQVWENSLTLAAGNSPSLTRVFANLQAIASGMADLMFTD